MRAATASCQYPKALLPRGQELRHVVCVQATLWVQLCRRASAWDGGVLGTGPNHDKGEPRSWLSQIYCRWLAACNLNNTSEKTCDRPYVDRGTEGHNSLEDNVKPQPRRGFGGWGPRLGPDSR